MPSIIQWVEGGEQLGGSYNAIRATNALVLFPQYP